MSELESGANLEADPSTASRSPSLSQVDGEDRRVARVRVRAGSLRVALKDVLDVVSRSNTLPILGNVLVEVAGSAIALTATDLDCLARRDFACEKQDVGEMGFALTLPAQVLADVLGEIDADAMLTLGAPIVGDTRATLVAGRSRFRLPVLPATDFPTMDFPEGEGATLDLPCSQLADAFAAVEHAISTEETRYYLTGIYLHAHQVPGEPLVLRFVATDGHRLARLTLADVEGAEAWPAAIVARKTVGLLDKLLGAASKASDTARVLVDAAGTASGAGGRIRWSFDLADGGSIELVAKTIDGDFPDYARVIPTTCEVHAFIDRASLSAAVKRVAVLAEAKSRFVKAEFERDVLTLTVTSPESGEASEEVPCSYSAEPLTIGFDAKYWRDALGALACDTVAMGMSDRMGPVRIRAVEGPSTGSGSSEECERLVQVLMPVRV